MFAFAAEKYLLLMGSKNELSAVRSSFVYGFGRENRKIGMDEGSTVLHAALGLALDPKE
jgi:hypothetical protein